MKAKANVANGLRTEITADSWHVELLLNAAFAIEY